MAPLTEAQKRANDKYRKNGSKLITIQVPVHVWDEIDQYCTMTGEGKSTMIRRLIAQEMELYPNGRNPKQE